MKFCVSIKIKPNAMAAAYLFHITQNHPFVDGNKRTGTAAALVFLSLNCVEVDIDNDDLAAFVLNVQTVSQLITVICLFYCPI